MLYDAPGPAWLGILAAASEWGCPPWEIEQGPAAWFVRWGEVQKLLRQRSKIDEAKWRSQK